MGSTQPEAHEFYEYVWKHHKKPDESFFNQPFESESNTFLDQYDNGVVGSQNQTPLIMDILNSNRQDPG